MREDRFYLLDILECISRIESYTSEGRETFMNTQIIQDAVVRNFEIIGEATKQMSSVFRDAYPEVPWKKIAGLRDVLIHDYVRVDLAEVWGVIEKNLPVLKAQVMAIAQNLEGEV